MTERLRVADPKAVHRRTAGAVLDAVEKVLQDGAWVGGPTVLELERVLANQMGMRHAVGTNSGTSALQHALQAVGVGPGDEVVLPAVSFVSTATAVLRAGALPVLVDVVPGMPLIDPKAVRAALTPKTRAVVTVALFGNRPPILDIPVGMALIEDAAQAMGATHPLRQVHARTVSFYPTKVLAAAGDGGLVATDDHGLAERVRALGRHGRGSDGHFQTVQQHIPGNDRLDAIQAAILLARLPDLAPRVAHRRQLLARYRERLPELILPHDPDSNVAVVVAVHPERERLRAALAEHGIDTACYYPRPLSDEPVLSGARVPHPLPHATRFCARCFALPCHVGVDLTHVDHICAVIQEVI